MTPKTRVVVVTMPLRSYTRRQLQTLGEKRCLLAIHGKVYDFNEFADQHPGGSALLTNLSGQDATADFSDAHSIDIIEKTLGKEGTEKCFKGTLKNSKPKTPPDQSTSIPTASQSVCKLEFVTIFAKWLIVVFGFIFWTLIINPEQSWFTCEFLQRSIVVPNGVIKQRNFALYSGAFIFSGMGVFGTVLAQALWSRILRWYTMGQGVGGWSYGIVKQQFVAQLEVLLSTDRVFWCTRSADMREIIRHSRDMVPMLNFIYLT